MPANDNVATPSIAWKEMAKKWDLIHDLLGGTLRMREAGKKWLPKEPRESEQQYAIRLERSVLYDAYKSTKKKLSAKPFSRPVIIAEEKLLDQRLQRLIADVNKTQQNLTQFCKELFNAAIDYGLTHILVDYPSVSSNSTVADENNLDIRPVFIHITPPMLVGWKTVELLNGTFQLVEIRIKETKVESDGAYGEKEVEYIRVITTTSWELWKKDETNDYVQVGGGEHTFGKIPLVTVYLNRIGYLTGDPCMESLAWLNLAHWQSQSDQRNALRFSRIGILFGSGFSEDEGKAFIVSPNTSITVQDPNAKLGYVEHTGQAISAGRTDILDLEDKMERLGLAPLVEKAGDATATAKSIDEAKSDSDIQEWIRSVESAVYYAFQYAVKWIKSMLPEKFGIDIFNDFSISLKAASDLEILAGMRKERDLSQRTFLREVKRRGVISDSIDIDEEIGAIGKELPTESS